MKYIIATAVILYFVYDCYIYLTANDDIDTFDEYDHVHLNDLFGHEGGISNNVIEKINNQLLRK
ncbi:hypothetical protein ACOW72_001308 [Staphylococcus pseudintermedius]